MKRKELSGVLFISVVAIMFAVLNSRKGVEDYGNIEIVEVEDSSEEVETNDTYVSIEDYQDFYEESEEELGIDVEEESGDKNLPELLSTVDDLGIVEGDFLAIRDRLGEKVYRQFLYVLKEVLPNDNEDGFYSHGMSTDIVREEVIGNDVEYTFYIIIEGCPIYELVCTVDKVVRFSETDLTRNDLIKDDVEDEDYNNDVSGLKSFMGSISYKRTVEYLESSFVKYQYLGGTDIVDDNIVFFIKTNMGMVRGDYNLSKDEVSFYLVDMTEYDVKLFIYGGE